MAGSFFKVYIRLLGDVLVKNDNCYHRKGKGMEKIIFGIMGYGKIAKVHLLAIEYANLFLDLPYEIQVKYLVGTKEKTVRHKAEYILDYKKVLEDEQVDVIDVCTPNHRHFEDVKAGIEAKKHIYCEKPLASKLEQAITLDELSQNASGYYNLALMYRAMPAIKKVRSLIKEGLIGDIINFKGQLFHKSYLDNQKSGWRTTKQSGGGAVLDLGVHIVDAFDYIFHGDIVSANVERGIYFKHRMQVDDHGLIKLKLSSNVQGQVEVSRIFAQEEENTEFVIYGTKGSLKLSSKNPRKVEHYDFQSDCKYLITCELDNFPQERDSMGWFLDCHMANIVEYCNQIYYNKNSNNIGSFRDGVKVQSLIQ